MTSEWTRHKLKELTTKIGSGATPRGGKESYLSEGDFSLIRSQNVLDFSFSKGGLAFIDKEQADKLSNVIVEEEDILLNITGDSVARVCQVPEHILPARVNQHVAIVRANKSLLSPKFLKYYLLNPRFKNQLLSLAAVGATRNALTKGMIEDLDIELPPLSAQREIASTLAALDDKIELNSKTGETLEEMRQAIFKEWFANFNYPGATGKMQQSDLGKIPYGWQVLPLDKIADFLNGIAAQKYPATDSRHFLPVIKIRELKSGNTASADRASLDVPPKYIINDGDLLFSWSGTLEVDFWTGGKGLLNQHLFKVTSNEYPLWFCFLWIDHHLAEFRRIAEDKTTTMGHIQRKHLSSAYCLVPDNLEKLSKEMQPMFETTIALRLETRTLSELRDNLLPKLMSGKIEVE